MFSHTTRFQILLLILSLLMALTCMKNVQRKAPRRHA